MCALMSIRREGGGFKPYFQNRVAEINANLEAIADLVGVLEPTLKVEGISNPADLGTRRGVSPEQVDGDSDWQGGPPFLRLERSLWPLAIPNDPEAVPTSEIRRSALLVQDEDNVGRLLALIDDILARSRSLSMAVGVTARVLRTAGR